MPSNLGTIFDPKAGGTPFFRVNVHLLCQYRNFVAPFSMQLFKFLQVFGKLVEAYHGAARNVLFLVHILMQGVGKGSIANVFEFQQRLQGHGKQSKLLKNFCCSAPLTTIRHLLPRAS
ncbi:uncharacterized protein TNCV_1306801 [Trichonephila clavipes]|nr:uncharacterized protein TNCV_1306801 [Trichonephila clavipes]